MSVPWIRCAPRWFYIALLLRCRGSEKQWITIGVASGQQCGGTGAIQQFAETIIVSMEEKTQK